MNLFTVRKLWIFWLILLSLPLDAEDLLPKVQRELRAQKFYFGEIDGHANDETESAIMAFQVAKGMEKTGQLDFETLRALGFANSAGQNQQEVRLLDECKVCVLQYLQAWQSGQWDREAAFFTETVNYYDDQNVSRQFIRDSRRRENLRWPNRKSTMLNRIASLEPGPNMAQVTARVRTEVSGNSGPARVRIENLLFRLVKSDQTWQIAALKLLE